MATKKKLLRAYVRPDVYDRLKDLHATEARRRSSTDNRITFSSWIEEILAEWSWKRWTVREGLKNLDKMDNSEFE